MALHAVVLHKSNHNTAIWFRAITLDILTLFQFRGTSDNDSFFTPHNISGGGRLSQSLDILLEHIVAGGRALWQVRFIHFITTLLWD